VYYFLLDKIIALAYTTIILTINKT
jgi:hypothetical protein